MAIDKEFNKHPINLLYYFGLNKQLEQEVGDYLRSKVSNPKLYSNDLRHLYGGALYGRNLGPKTTRFLGNLAEAFDLGFSGWDDVNTDRRNNELGIQYGMKYPNASKQKLLDIMFEDLYNNR